MQDSERPFTKTLQEATPQTATSKLADQSVKTQSAASVVTHQHGGDVVAVAKSLGVPTKSILDLSASLNPFAPDVIEIAKNHLGALVPYPDDEPATSAFAEAVGVSQDRLVLTNGGAEAIAIVADILGGGEIIEPEFSLYRRHLRNVAPGLGRWRSNPSNPLGALAPADATAQVWDEAFYPLATGEWTRGDETSWRVGSVTKLWACAGLRLGYVIAPDEASATEVRSRRPRWSVNGLALAMLVDLLCVTDLKRWNQDIQLLGSQMAAELRDMGFSATETSANWIMINDADHVRDELVPLGILVRDCTNFGLRGTVRVALPTDSNLDRVLSAFKRVAANNTHRS